jgi:hypothetical protein
VSSDAYAYADADLGADADAHPDADAYADSHADADTDVDADAHADAHAHADTVSARSGVRFRFWRSDQSRACLFGRTNAYCSERLLLQQQPSLCDRARDAGVLQRPSRQRPVPIFVLASELHAQRDESELLRQRLCVERQVLLPGESDDLHWRLLSPWGGAERTQ